MPLVLSYTPWKHKKTSGTENQGVQKEISGVKWIKLFHIPVKYFFIYADINMTLRLKMIWNIFSVLDNVLSAM